MRGVRKLSISKYITVYLVLLMLGLSFVMIFVVNILADRAIHSDIQGIMTTELLDNNKNVCYEDDILKPDEEFKYVDDGMYFQILGEDGQILLGESPENEDFEEGEISQRLKIVATHGEEYYVISRLNRRLTKEMGQIIYDRCIVNKQDLSSKYQLLKYISYASIPAFLVIVLIAVLVMSNKIAEPIIQMSKTAESVGKNGEFSMRMEYGGKIAELSILAETNNRMLERVENMFESQEQFSSDVAHELRTPIAVLLAQCEYAKEYVNTKEEFDEAIEVIYRQANKTNAIISQLLNLSRLKSDKVALELEEIDINEIIMSICDEVEFRERDHVRFDLRLSDVKVTADMGLIYILMQNLIQNAVKYSSKPATVQITTECKEEKVIVSVTDFGCGIKEEDLQHIFEPFYRVEKSRNSEGFGLGLSLAKRIAQIHRGELSVSSVWEKGSTFTVVFPEEGRDS